MPLRQVQGAGRGRRDPITSKGDVLLVVKSNDGKDVYIGQLADSANLPWVLLTKYMDELVESRLVALRETPFRARAPHKSYTLTEKGQEVASKYEDVKAALQGRAGQPVS